MKKIHILLVAALTATLFCSQVTAKNVVTKTYIFGFAASFNDTIVHFTDIQEVDSAWIDSKTGFLLGRENYSYQLRNYLGSQLQMPKRTCIVVANPKKEKLEKIFLKMRRLYTGESKKKKKKEEAQKHFDIRYITSSDFQFLPINMNIVEESGE